jgi:hypothetical protein
MSPHRRRLGWRCGFYCLGAWLALASVAGPLDTVETWAEVADFLVLENDTAGFQRFQEKVLTERPTETLLVEKILDFHLRRKDREALRAVVQRLSQELRCGRRVPARLGAREACERISRLWTDNLDSVLFYEESAQKLERSRRLVLDKDCSSALGILEELKVKENSARPVLRWMSEAYACLGDAASKARVDGQLKEMRIFASDS